MGKKIVKTIGVIEVKSSSFAFNELKNARKKLGKEAEKLGVNAIISYKTKKTLLGGVYASGTAVVVE